MCKRRWSRFKVHVTFSPIPHPSCSRSSSTSNPIFSWSWRSALAIHRSHACSWKEVMPPISLRFDFWWFLFDITLFRAWIYFAFSDWNVSLLIQVLDDLFCRSWFIQQLHHESIDSIIYCDVELKACTFARELRSEISKCSRTLQPSLLMNRDTIEVLITVSMIIYSWLNLCLFWTCLAVHRERCNHWLGWRRAQVVSAGHKFLTNLNYHHACSFNE